MVSVGKRSLLVGFMCCVVGIAGSPVLAYGEGSSAAAGSGTSSAALLTGSPLVVPAVELFAEGEQAQDAREARRYSPEAFSARSSSQTAFEGLSAGQARGLAEKLFPKLIEEPAGGLPRLPAGERVRGFPSDDVAQLALPGGKHGVVESLEPIALQTSAGRRAPIDLHLREAGGGFQPVLPVVGVQIPKRLGDGIGIPSVGVSLTPVGAGGASPGGSGGEVLGATVMYANTERDTDTVVKPVTRGFAAETLLRSVDSPRQLFYRVGMPAGARLVSSSDGSGALDVVDDGVTIATIPSPSAQDAEGTPVPVSVAIESNDIIGVTVAPFAEGAYRLPIMVDPTVKDPVFSPSVSYPTGWYFSTTYPGQGKFLASWEPEKGEWREHIAINHGENEFGGLFYTTRGTSQIVQAYAQGSWNDSGYHIANQMILETMKEPYIEDSSELPVSTVGSEVNSGYACAPELKCEGTKAGSAPPENGNTAGYEQVTTGPGREGTLYATNALTRAYVDISQEKGPELSFNTTSSTIYNEATKENVPNVLYGSGGWLGPHYGAFEARAKDSGIGLSLYRLLTSGWGDQKYYYGTGKCSGIQCPEHDYQGYTYKTGMPDGEASFEALAEDAAGMNAFIYPETIKVDATPPHGIKVSGFQNGNELPQGEPHMKVEATDGEGSTPSSGVKSIKVSVDGHEVSGSAASCASGPCTASTEFTLATRAYTSGEHSLVVTATDNANNVAQEEFAFRVHGASPVAVGPGSVDPSSGQFTLSATDVSLGGTNNVSRNYKSRNLTAGAEGPLGPQWALNVGGGEGLTILQEGSAVLTASGGATTTFTRNEKGEFESPKGDSNLKLEAKEKEPGKGISEYVLSDATAATKTRFEQPSGLQSASPTSGSSFGFEAGQLNHPVSNAIDSGGNVWVISNQSDLLEKFSPTGDLLGTYGSQGTAERQFISPWGVGVDPRNNNLYVSDQGNNRVEELSSSGAFIKMFGWGVTDGKAEFEICTKECKPGISGAGNGQFAVVAGVSVDSNGNVWVADFGNNRVQEFSEKGEYQKKFGTTGKGTEQFEGPTTIAFSGGNLYITDYRNNRVQEFSSAGVHVGQFGSGGTENGQFSGPYGIASDQRTGDLYVVDSGHSRVQEFTASGSFLSKFGSTARVLVSSRRHRASRSTPRAPSMSSTMAPTTWMSGRARCGCQPKSAGRWLRARRPTRIRPWKRKAARSFSRRKPWRRSLRE